LFANKGHFHVSDLITNKRFAERGPFTAAIIALAATALALSFLPSSVSSQAQTFALLFLSFLWQEVMEMRIYGIGFSPKKWQLLLLGFAIITACIYVSDAFQSLGHFIATGLFLALQIPLIAMKTKVVNPEIRVETPTRSIQIVLGSVCLLIMTATIVMMAFHRPRQPIWVLPLSLIVACYFGWQTYRWIRHRPGSVSFPAAHGKPISGPSTPGTPEATEYQRRLKISVNLLLICLALAIINLLFRNDFYGFILPGVCFVVMVSRLTSLRTRDREAVTPSPELDGGEPH
jgi:hypothetical protein